MSYTFRDLLNLLRGNPDLRIDDAYIHQPVIGLAQAVPVFRMSEHDLQRQVIDECDRRAITRPAYGLILAIPNGQFRAGQRMEPGLRPGIPDLFLPVARDHPCGMFYHGLFIELKVGDNRLGNEQREWLERLQGQGYCCHVVRDRVEVTMDVIEWYLEGK